MGGELPNLSLSSPCYNQPLTAIVFRGDFIWLHC